MPAAWCVAREGGNSLRGELTLERLHALLRAIAETAPRGRRHRVYLVGGSSAVFEGWRASSIDADLHGSSDDLFRDIQRIKEAVGVNVEFAHPGQFVPALTGTDDRHIFLESIGSLDIHHYDPYAQVLAKVVRGFARDLDDARHFVSSGLVDPSRLRALVAEIPDAAYSKFPRLSPKAVRGEVEDFLKSFS